MNARSAFILATILPLVSVTRGRCGLPDYLPVYGPTSAGQTIHAAVDYGDGHILVNDRGLAVAIAEVFDPGANQRGTTAVRWDNSGAQAEILDTLGVDPDGNRQAVPVAMNNAGVVVGVSAKFNNRGAYLGASAVRWEVDGTGVTELPLRDYGADKDGGRFSEVTAINDLGTIIGIAERHSTTGDLVGAQAIRWDVGADMSTELTGEFVPLAINDAGTIAGRTGRLEAGQVTPTPLKVDPSPPFIFSGVHTLAMNGRGTIVAAVQKMTGDQFLGEFPVKWEAGSETGTDLTSLPVVYGPLINDNGTIVATLQNGGYQNVRWEPHQNTFVEMEHFHPNSLDHVAAINSAGFVVGSAYLNLQNAEALQRAVYWDPQGNLIDLNNLIDPAAGWSLEFASDVSDTGWIVGLGKFDPDGTGILAPYPLPFLMHVPAVGVPEPRSLSLTLTASVCLIVNRGLRRRRSNSYA